MGEGNGVGVEMGSVVKKGAGEEPRVDGVRRGEKKVEEWRMAQWGRREWGRSG